MACNIELGTEPAAVATASRATAASVPTNAPTVAPEPETVTAQPLLPDFRDHELRGNQLRKGQARYVPDRIDDIRDGGSGYPIDPGYEGDDWDFSRVHCQLRDPERAVELRAGQAVTVQAALPAWAGSTLLPLKTARSRQRKRTAKNRTRSAGAPHFGSVGYALNPSSQPMQARCGWTGRRKPPSVGISTAMRAIEAGVQYGRMQGVRTP